MRLPFWFRVNERQGQLRGHRRVSTQPEHLQQWDLRKYTWVVQVHLLPRLQAQSQQRLRWYIPFYKIF